MATLGTAPAARVRETSTSAGTGNFVGAGAKESKDQAFLGAYGGGTTLVPYLIAHQDAAEWEEGLATVQDDGTGSSEIVRGGSQTVTASSNGGLAVSFSTGTKDVFSPLSAEQSQALFDHVNSTANPHGVTAAQAGAPVSIDGVNNAGGNIDLVAGGAVSLSPDDANNQVTISVTVPVDSVAGKTGAVSLNSGDVGLGNVPNEDATDPANWDYGLTGADTSVVTGASGAAGNLVEWNGDGDAVDSGKPAFGVVKALEDGDTLTFHDGVASLDSVVISLTGPVELLSMFVLGQDTTVKITIDGVIVFDAGDFSNGTEANLDNQLDIGGISFGPVYASSSLNVKVFTNSQNAVMYRAITR